jgi:uncharacterized repeat protein (TIGR01451 family)
VADPSNDENPSQVDLVGATSTPAVGFSSDANFYYFHERVGGNPGTAASLTQNAWVVLFQTTKPQYQYLGSVNGKDDKVQLWQNTSPSGPVDFSPLLNDPADTKLFEVNSSSNVQVTSLGGGIYSIDWAMPIAWFASTGISPTTTKFFATATDANNFNKDHLNCYETFANLAITKTVDKATADIGNTLTYTVTVTNNGPDTATATVVSDLIPTGTTYDSSTPALGTTYNSGTGVWTIGTLASGASKVLTLKVTVNSGSAGSTVTNTATASSTTTDPNSSDNTASVTTSINSIPLNTLTVNFTGAGTGSVTSSPAGISCTANCSTNFATGTPVTLTATANPGSTFTGWTGSGCSGTGTCSVTLSTSKTVTANFIITPPTSGILTVYKIVVNDNGGQASPSAFSMHVKSATTTAEVVGSPQSGTATGTQYTLAGGSYVVTETGGPSGYTASYSGDCNSSGEVAVINGQNKICTITNDDQVAQLTVIKHVVNDNGGTAASSDFAMTVTGSNVSQTSFAGQESPGVTVTLDAGSYSVNESVTLAGYAKSLGANCSGTITNGESKTCTITNDDVQPTLTVVKLVDNTAGGSATSSDFIMQVTGGSTSITDFPGSDTGSVLHVNAGTYTVGEVAVTDYTPSFVNCTVQGVVTLHIGDTTTCTVTNVYVKPAPKHGQIAVVKHVDSANGGIKTAADFDIHVSAVNADKVDFKGSETGVLVTAEVGSFNITETADPAYTATYSSGCSGTLAENDELTCTITNTAKPASLTLTKVVNNTEGGTAQVSDFTLIVDSGTATTSVTSGVPANFTAGTYTFSETGPTAGYVASFKGDCNSQGQVTLAIGQAYSCTITNTYSSQSADLGVTKQVDNPVSAPGSTVTFTTTVTNNGPDLGKNVQVSDILPAGLTFVSSTSTLGTYATSTGVWAIGNLPVGDSVTLTVVATVDSGTTGTVTNTATVSGSVFDPNLSNNFSSASVITTFTLTITKTGDGNGTVTGPQGEDQSFTFCASDECRTTDEKHSFVQSYASGTVVTLIPNPDSSSNFDGTWSGACTGTAPCTLTITSNMAVNAHFGLNPVTPPPSGGGCTSGCGGGGPAPVPPVIGQVLGTSTAPSLPIPEVLGAATTLPRTGVDLSFMVLMFLAGLALVDRKFRLV